MATSDIGYNSNLSMLSTLVDKTPTSRVFVDFDYTLMRSSSTEELLNLGRPAVIAAVLLRALNALQPWAHLAPPNGTRIWREPIRTWVLLLFMPWTLWLFRRQSQSLFKRLQNEELVTTLSRIDSGRVIIVSLGFEWLIRQLLRGTPLSESKIVGSSFMQPATLRQTGKFSRLKNLGIAPVRERDIVVTDSLEDRDLLSSVDNGFLIEPKLRPVRGVLQGVYLPFDYTARTKRSAEFVVKQILLEELIVILLATAFYQPFALSIWIGASLLFVAFFAIYEIGYAENDRIGYFTETEPKLPQNYDRKNDLSLEPGAWIWAVVLTIIGVAFLGPDVSTAFLDRIGLESSGSELGSLLGVGLLWICMVVLGRGVFFVYNRLALAWRVFAYLPLHLVKYFSLVVILPSQPAGYALLLAQIVRTWSLYAIRRCSGEIELIASQTIRLSFFAIFLLAFQFALQYNIFSDWHTWIILVWCVVRAVPEARRKLFSRAGRRSGLRTAGSCADDSR